MVIFAFINNAKYFFLCKNDISTSLKHGTLPKGVILELFDGRMPELMMGAE